VDAKTKKIVLGETPSAKPTIEFTNILIKEDYGYTTVTGEAKNNDKKERTIILKVTFYDENKKIVGTANGIVSDLAHGDTKTFEAMGMGDFTGATSYKVQVDTMY